MDAADHPVAVPGDLPQRLVPVRELQEPLPILLGGLYEPPVIAERLGVDVGRMVRLTATEFDPNVELPIRNVAAHVLSEAKRVDEAEAALEAEDYAELGRLLDASHESLGHFGATSPALDRLTGAMREAGAYGARLTGAGFGGYAIGICPLGRIDALIQASEEATGGPSFRVRPSAGGCGV